MQIFEDNKLSHFLDGKDEGHSSWMRFIQCARSKDEQNLFAFQYKDNVYYRSFRDIAVGEEFLVWYDDRYLQHFGIPTGLHDMCFVTHDAEGRLISVWFNEDTNPHDKGPVHTDHIWIRKDAFSDFSA